MEGSIQPFSGGRRFQGTVLMLPLLSPTLLQGTVTFLEAWPDFPDLTIMVPHYNVWLQGSGYLS